MRTRSTAIKNSGVYLSMAAVDASTFEVLRDRCGRWCAALEREHFVNVTLGASDRVGDARDARVVRAHRDDLRTAARMKAAVRNHQAVAAERSRHRDRRAEPNRSCDAVAGRGRYGDVQSAAAEIRNQLVGCVVADGASYLIEER